MQNPGESLEPEEFVRLGCISVINQGDADEVQRFFSPDLVYVGPDGRRGDLSTMRTEVAQLHETFPDIEMTIEEAMSDSDSVTFRYTLRGTHTGDSFRGIEPNGETFAVKGMAFVTLSDDRVARYELVMDTLGMVEQLR